VAAAAIEDGALSDALAENTYEVLNIVASLFNAEGAEHHKLDGHFTPGQPVPPKVATWMLAYVARVDLTVDIKGYGVGALSIVQIPGV